MKVSISNYNKTGKRKINVSVGVDDIISADNTLAHVIVPVLKKYLNRCGGVPGVLMTNEHWKLCDFGKKTKAQKARLKKLNEATSKEWKSIIESMLWSFTQIAKGYPYNLDVNGSHGEYSKKIQDGLDLFGKYYRHLWT